MFSFYHDDEEKHRISEPLHVYGVFKVEGAASSVAVQFKCV